MAPRRATAAEPAPAPEADGIAGWPHPRATPAVLGHDAALGTLLAAAGQGGGHHAWLIAGPRGTGKATLAYAYARRALAGPDAPPDAAAATAQHIATQAHPGLFVLRRAADGTTGRLRQSILIDDVRRARHFLQTTAADGRRIVLIDRADELNLNAANALLKSLEEPPPRTTLLLLSEMPGRLLPTLRSRCLRLDLAPLGLAAWTAGLAAACDASGRALPDAARLERLFTVTQGSIGAACVLFDGPGVAIADRIAEAFRRLPAADPLAAHDILALIPARDAAAMHAFAFGVLLDAVAARARAALPRAPDEVARWAALWEKLGDQQAEAERLNLDRAALLVAALAAIAAAAGAV